MGQYTGHKAAGYAVRGNIALKQVFAVHVKREVDVQPAAGLLGQGLGQKAGVQTVAHGNGTNDLLKGHHVVGGFQRPGVAAVDLVLAIAAFVVAVLGCHTHLLHGQADIPAQVFTRIQRRNVKISATVDGDAGGAAPVVLFKQIKLALGTHVAGKSQLFEFAVHIPQKAPAVAAEGCAVRHFHIAEELHHPPFGGTPRQDGHGRKIRPQYKVAFLNVHKACNGAAVKAHALFQCLGQVAGQHGNVLLCAKDIAEGEPHKLDVVVLHKIQNILLGGIAHK